MERSMLNVKLQDRSRITIRRQRFRVTDLAENNVPRAKCKWTGHITPSNDHIWTIRSTRRQIQRVRSVEKPQRRWKEDTGATWSSMDKDNKRQGKLQDSFGGLLPAVEGHRLE